MLQLTNGSLPVLTIDIFEAENFIKTEVGQAELESYSFFGSPLIAGSQYLTKLAYEVTCKMTQANVTLLSALWSWQQVQLNDRQPAIITLTDRYQRSAAWPVGKAPRTLVDPITPFAGYEMGYEQLPVIIGLDPRHFSGELDGDCMIEVKLTLQQM